MVVKPSAKPRAKGVKGKAKKASAKKAPRRKRAPPPMVYEAPQLPAVVSSKRVFEATEILDAVPRPDSGARAGRTGWLRRDGVLLRCRACGQGNARDAVACASCRALL